MPKIKFANPLPLYAVSLSFVLESITKNENENEEAENAL